MSAKRVNHNRFPSSCPPLAILVLVGEGSTPGTRGVGGEGSTPGTRGVGGMGVGRGVAGINDLEPLGASWGDLGGQRLT